MSDYIHIDEHTRLKTYSATARPGKSSIKIELECTDHTSFGWLIERLEAIDKSQSSAKSRKSRVLQIEDLRGREL